MILDSEEQRNLLMRFIEEAVYDYDNARTLMALEDAIKEASIGSNDDAGTTEHRDPCVCERGYVDALRAEHIIKDIEKDADEDMTSTEAAEALARIEEQEQFRSQMENVMAEKRLAPVNWRHLPKEEVIKVLEGYQKGLVEREQMILQAILSNRS